MRSAEEAYAFGPVRVDVMRHLTSRDGQPIALAPKTFELLLILVRSNGRVLMRRELVAALWADTFVEEANLTFQIASLRRALGEGAEQWIETVPRVGYRFTPEVRNEAVVPPRPSAAVHDAETTCLEPPFRREPLGRRKLAVLTAVSLGLVVLAGAALAWRFKSARAPATVDERRSSVRSIAVLPFEDCRQERAMFSMPTV